MKIRILGSGTSQGIPVIGCSCAVCTSAAVKDKRLRSSIHIVKNGVSILIDIGPDFRQQMLKANIVSLDAILITHEHNDHIAGMDEVRPFNFKSKSAMPMYALDRVVGDIKSRFAYIFGNSNYPGLPSIDLRTISAKDEFNLHGVTINCIGIMHGHLPILGYKLDDLVYLTDIKTISSEELNKIIGCHTLIVSCLRLSPHHSHLNLIEAIELINLISPQRAYITHISHDFGCQEDIELLLPHNVFVAYDDMEIEI